MKKTPHMTPAQVRAADWIDLGITPRSEAIGCPTWYAKVNDTKYKITLSEGSIAPHHCVKAALADFLEGKPTRHKFVLQNPKEKAGPEMQG